MTDLDIIKQLMNGNHLEKTELQRADKLIYSLRHTVKKALGFE